jgi:hypothetical protein
MAESREPHGMEWTHAQHVLLRSEYLDQVFRRAQADPVFLNAFTVAETALGNWDWPALQSASWAALEIYPAHAAARLMHARALMEQNDLLWAEINYRSALAQGGDPVEIEPVLQLVLRRVAGGDITFERRLMAVARPGDGEAAVPQHVRLDVPPLDAPPTLEDVEGLSRMLWHDARMSGTECLHAMRTYKTVRELACHMMDDDRFRTKNRELLEMAATRS